MDFYHLINRGVDKREVFSEDGDYLRFIHDMYVFNDAQNAPNSTIKARVATRKRDLLVRIHAFSLMPNHYHILASPAQGGGLSLFMRKLNMGYAKYFNEKYDRTGVLWQGTFKKILIQRDAHFKYIPYYIHLNPLDLTHPQWRSGNLYNPESALDSLRKYRWSSYLDYNGVRNFPSLLYMSELHPLLDSRKSQDEEIISIVSDPESSQASSVLELP
ncbi:MAG: transposase [Candidatus Pacebacteria bacterium]|nr:transposase [Candidatus Paceibacterota bacterium]